jgi:hypothetical protein
MFTRSTAEEHLRVIRSLMERATIYRAISAPTALVGGCAGILAAAIFHFQYQNNVKANSHLFLACWLSALGLAAMGNVYFLHADARRRGEKFVSAGMRAALQALWPSYLVAAVITILSWDFPASLPIPWMLLYGLGLLATQHFAPRSIALLGWAFLDAGLLAMIGRQSLSATSGIYRTLLPMGNVAMGLTFGGFHLVYAFCAWPRGSRMPRERGEVAGGQGTVLTGRSDAADAGNDP